MRNGGLYGVRRLMPPGEAGRAAGRAAARLLAAAVAVGGMSAAFGVVGAAPAEAAQNTCTPTAGFTNCASFTNSGGDQSFTVPSGVTSLDVRMWGASGGTAIGGYPGGGSGGYSAGTASVTPGQALTVMVGSGGAANQAGSSVYGGGGGYAGPAGASQFGAAGGGGMSGLWSGAANTAANALLIAGGGGGSPYVSVAPGNASGAGAGGGSNGTSAGVNGGKYGSQGFGGGASGGGACPTAGTPGTQFTGGYGASAGRPANGIGGEAGGGGGGGWYGGGGGGCRPNSTATAPGGGGGGSGYVNSAKVTGSTTPGSNGTTGGSTPPNTTDPLYVSGVGAAGAGQSNGGPGLVVLQWITPTRWTQASVPTVAPGASGTTTFDNVYGSFLFYTITAPAGVTITGWSGCQGANYALAIATDGSTATCTFTGSTPPGTTAGTPQNLSFTLASSAPPGTTLTGSVSVTAPDGTVSSTSPWKINVTTVAPAITGPANGSDVTDPQTTISGTGNPGDTVSVKDGAGTLVCTATVQPNGAWSCKPTGPLPTGSNTLTPTSVAPNGTSATGASSTVTVLPKLQITKSSSPSGEVQAGQTVSYTITVTNPSGTDYPNADFSDNLAGVLSSASWNNNVTASAGSAQLVGQTLNWTGTVAANSTVTVTYTVTAN